MISSCPSTSVGFECSHDPDPLCQNVSHFLFLSQTLERDGTEWDRSLSSTLELTQSEYLFESLSSVISFSDMAVGTLDLNYSVADLMVLIDTNEVSGGRFPSTPGSPDDPLEGIYDSTAASGMVLYVPSNGHVDLAQADALSTTRAVGLAFEAVVATNTGEYITEGQITRVDWTAVTGTSTLVPGAYYYLSPTTAGGLTTTAPTTSGQYVVVVGRALTTGTLDVEIAQPILL